MSYIVLARKYRPQIFSEVYSQEHITQIMSNAIKTHRIAHAYLFTGPRGVGKTSMARILAKSLNCLEGSSDQPCGKCHNCIEIAVGTSTDVIEIDGASNTGVDNVRDLQKELLYAPVDAAYKIYIIDEVHMLSKGAFNALLKTLEEPPDNVLFIFATTEPQKVPSTIISRCQRFDFRRIPVEDIVTNLKSIAVAERLDVDDESLYLIARKSDGGMRDALSLLDQVISFADGPIRIALVQEVFSELPLNMHANIMAAILNHEPVQIINLFNEIMNQGIDAVEFLNSFLEFMRLLLMTKIGTQPQGLIKDDLEVLIKLSEPVSENTLLYIMSMLIQLKLDVKISSHPSIMIEVALIKLTKMDDMEEIATLISKLSGPGTAFQPAVINQGKTEETQVKKVISKEAIPEPTVELEYVPITKVKELTKEFVLQNWDTFVAKIRTSKKMLALYLKKENISNVSSNVIFMDFDSVVPYNMINDAKQLLNEQLSSFFDLSVKLITKIVQTEKLVSSKTPTLQEIQKTSPMLAKLIESTNAMIVPEGEGRRSQ